jgi:hypothetical protein
MTTSGVVSFALTRLPCWIWILPAYPVIGALIVQYAICSLTLSMFAWSARICAAAVSAFVRICAYASGETNFFSSSSL